MASAILSAWTSLSMTQGPAMRNSCPPPMVTSPTWKRRFTPVSVLHLFRPMEHLHRNLLPGVLAKQAILVRRLGERREQGMRLQRLRLELGMELAAKEVGMLGNFDDLDVGAVRR